MIINEGSLYISRLRKNIRFWQLVNRYKASNLRIRDPFIDCKSFCISMSLEKPVYLWLLFCNFWNKEVNYIKHLFLVCYYLGNVKRITKYLNWRTYSLKLRFILKSDLLDQTGILIKTQYRIKIKHLVSWQLALNVMKWIYDNYKYCLESQFFYWLLDWDNQ